MPGPKPRATVHGTCRAEALPHRRDTIPSAMRMPASITRWVEDVRALTKADRVVYCDGTDGERDALVAECLATGELIELNQQTLPGCYLHRSAPHDVARTEHLTFICTANKDDAGPTNNWMAPAEARDEADAALRRRDEGPHDVRRAVPDGPAGLAVLEGRRRDHRQPLRGPEHADHDAHGQVALDAARRLGRLHAVPPLARRPQPRSPVHRALPRANTVWTHRLRLRRQRASRQEVPRAAHRELARARARAGWPSTC